MGTAQSRGANTFASRDLRPEIASSVHGSFICSNNTVPASGNFNLDVSMTYNGQFRNGQTLKVSIACNRDANTGAISGKGCTVTGQILSLDAMPHATDKGRWIGVYRSENPIDHGTIDCQLSS